MLFIIISAIIGGISAALSGDAFSGFQYGMSWLPWLVVLGSFVALSLVNLISAGFVFVGKKAAGAASSVLLSALVVGFGIINFILTSTANVYVQTATSFDTVNWSMVGMTLGVYVLITLISRLFKTSTASK